MQVHHVAIVNRSHGLVSDLSAALAVEAYRAALPAFCEAWGLPVAGLALYPSTHLQEPREEAALFILDGANDPDTYGAHTQIGLAAWGYIDAALCKARGEPWERTLGHELFELLADPGLDRWIDGVAVEVCDPVQRNSKRVRATLLQNEGEVLLADYVLPAWYAPGAPGPYDRDGVVQTSLALAPGGYVIHRRAGAAVTEGLEQVRITSHGRTVRRMTR